MLLLPTPQTRTSLVFARNLLCAAVLLIVMHAQLALADSGEKVLPAGVHPRLLFTKDQLPAIRARAQTEDGKAILNSMKAARDQFYTAWKALPQGVSLDFRMQGRMQGACLLASFVWAVTGEKPDADKALEIFRTWFANGANDPNTAGWGLPPEFSISYDILYPLLSENEHHKIDQAFAQSVATLPANVKSAWWLDGPHPSGRSTSNWSPIAAACADFTNMEIEGTPAYDPQLHHDLLKIMRSFLEDGISVDGAMFEGTQYPMNYGTHFVPFYAIAMRERGVDLIHSSNLSKAPLWFTYEMLPWGGQSQAIDKSGGVYQATGFTALMSSEFGGLADWVYMNGRGWMLPTGFNNPDTAIIALLNGIPKSPENPADLSRLRTTPFWEWDKTLPTDILPNQLPTSHWFSTIGRVISRSGWGWRDAHFTINSNNAYHPGHTHADHGSITLADRGVDYIVGPGASCYNSEDHNLVLIDGKGQPPGEGSAESFVRSADLSDYADITDIDLQMAYSRNLAGGFSNPNWEPYNPVDQAGRISLFVRGATGPFVITADDDRKDESEHPYDWLAHTALNNNISTSGRAFWIDERYGGDFVYSVLKGQKGSFVAPHVDAGTYHGWLLIRGLPYPTKWADTGVAINGKPVSSNTRFGLGNFDQGWSWLPLAQQGTKGDPKITLPDGELRVDLTGDTGSEIALAVFTKDPQWQPGFDIPANGGDFVVMDAKSFQQGSEPWGVATDPKGHLDGLFLGHAPLNLTVSTSKASGLPFLDAQMKAKEAKYLCVMAASDTSDERQLKLNDDGGGQTATIRSAKGEDIVGGAVDGVKTSGDLSTDAAAATVSLREANAPDTIRGYAMASGTSLDYRSTNLLRADQDVHVINDGSKLIVRGPGGATVSCARLSATTSVINGVEGSLAKDAGTTVSIQIPRLPQEWSVAPSHNGRFIELTGDGPLPVHVHAPTAIDVKVNGVSRFFVRDGNGDVWPLLQLGCGMIPSEPGLDAEALSKTLPASEKANFVILPKSRSRALELSGEHSIPLKTSGPGLYELSVNYAQDKPGKINISFAGKEFSTQDVTPASDGISRAHFDKIALSTESEVVKLSSDQAYALCGVSLVPVMEPLPAKDWMTIGPFPANKAYTSGDLVKTVMATPFPPESAQNFSATYPGDEGKDILWQHSDTVMNQKNFENGVDFEVANKSKDRGVFYAVTHITSPTERDVRMRLACDWWANVYLNGKNVRSERPEVLSEADGAQFNAGDKTPAVLHLQKGLNTLLVKVMSGSSGSGFGAEVNNPGDLVVQAQVPLETSLP